MDIVVNLRNNLGFLVELWNNQPSTFIGVGVSIAVLFGIYIFLLNTYK
tara:strand:- start:110 stop:253 length:144 start_codon:yes stop_codon:yes gene_type:complete